MSNDVISRSALKKAIDKFYQETLQDNISINALDRLINYAPTVERQQGEWIDIDSLVSKAICSKCKKTTITEPFGKPNYCPNCGAKMKRSDEE